MNIFRRRENIWVSVENFDAGDRIFGLRFVGSNQVDESAWGRSGFMKFLLGWLASYKTVLNEDLQQEFLRSVKAMTLTMPRDSLPAEIFFSAYQDASKFDENLRSNFALVVCHFATKHDFNEISKLIEANCEKGDSDVFMSRYFSEHSWVGVEKQAVESIVKNSLLHSRYRHETSLVAAKLGMIEVIPLIESARAAGDSSDQFKDEKYAKALFSLRKQRYLADVKDLPDDSASIDRALLDLEHAEVAPFAAFFLGKVKASNARTALEAAVGSMDVALRREAKAALKKIGP